VAKDPLSLGASQQQTAWKDISAQATKESALASFTIQVGAVMAQRPRPGRRRQRRGSTKQSRGGMVPAE